MGWKGPLEVVLGGRVRGGEARIPQIAPGWGQTCSGGEEFQDCLAAVRVHRRAHPALEESNVAPNDTLVVRIGTT